MVKDFPLLGFALWADHLPDNLQILAITAASSVRAPSKPRSCSLLARLTRLALDIFEAESDGPEFRSGGGYEAVVRDAASVVLEKGQELLPTMPDHSLDPALQSLFDLMDDTMYEWPNMSNEEAVAEANFAEFWGPQ